MVWQSTITSGRGVNQSLSRSSTAPVRLSRHSAPVLRQSPRGEVVEAERIVFTNVLSGGWRPAERGFMTAVITFKDHPEGTEYTSFAMHKNRADRDKHEEMGFQDGWGTVTAQLAALVEPRAAMEAKR